MFEFKHLKTISALAETGSVRKAAELLFTSQSALSHQIKELERRIGYEVFYRNSVPITFTEQGNYLLTLARQVLPQVSQCQQQLQLTPNRPINLSIAMTCHSCFQWLLPVIEQFNQMNNGYLIEICDEIFDDKPHEEITLLFTDEIDENLNKLREFNYQPLGRFEVVAVMSPNHKLASKLFLRANDFSEVNLLTYPTDKQNLDVFKYFLTPENVVPNSIKQVANSHKLLQMVATNMGVAVVPKWLVDDFAMQELLKIKSLGKAGLYKSLYVRFKNKKEQLNMVEELLLQIKDAFTQCIK